MKKKLEQVLEEKHFDSVVLYRAPYQSDSQIILGNAELIHNGINEHHLTSDGFVFEPFDNTITPGIFIPTHFSATFTQLAKNEQKLIGSLFKTEKNRAPQKADDYSDYVAHFDKMHNAITNNQLSKVILSRTVKGPHLPSNSVPRVFEALRQKYPHAFVYAISTPNGGTWMGAGPELLLKHDGQRLSTVSLAGTLPNTPSAKWSEKELKEQGLVTEFIENVLIHHQVDSIEYKNAETISAGQVKHLCSRFQFEMQKTNGNHIGILYDLHPTPAVCGLPKENAFNLITDTEQHERRYYAGFLGPVKNGHYEFYVNIRCLSLTEDATCLYVGGGLTIDSVAEKEWQETALKAETLLSVIKNI
ncbi:MULTISPECIES: chorismate-binding protein [unclassified Carboxylicivirga]|uniref:chorismate-binding protein n=1 Tax=Carboxylicivirga TaxID=1628153 RepID=UPI003D32EDAA